ncbi:hypothetical protein PYW08_010685 [Mythimna loreyi]|uniref:Uncharacterized protein n=1 Tax=Mythimna loreyi TaxID=667449 RepID=A0ACC2Q4A5_9NEOP|nr:hypothetical protein PYW08_010685 [Mythimna loreyi]
MSRGCLSLSGIWSVVGVVVLLVAWVGGSEFPERECCDPVYPPNTATTAAAPITPPIPKLAVLQSANNNRVPEYPLPPDTRTSLIGLFR